MHNPVTKISCLVIDDEPLAREVLVRFIHREPSLRLIGECENAVQALDLIRTNPVDLLFVDIQMPELLGTDLIRILRNPPKIILTTAYPEYAVESYELDVIDYLLKPIQFERFLKAVNKASTQAQPSITGTDRPPEHTPYLYFRVDRKMVKVHLDDILYIEGLKNYVKIITTNGLIITKHSMTAIEAMLPASGFIRTHRSFIASQSKIDSYTGEAIGIGKFELPIGKLYKNNVLETLDRR